MAQDHGHEIADEVTRLIATKLTPIQSAPTGTLTRIDLAYDRCRRASNSKNSPRKTDPPAYNARTQLAQLDRNGSLPSSSPYTVQTWTFGDQLAMVFLSGEVVVDYALRLKHDFDPARLWVSSYANDVPC